MVFPTISANAVDETSILIQLRNGTQAAHAELERSADILTQLRTAPAYRKLLETFYGLFRPLESELRSRSSEMLQWLPDFEARMRLNALRADLAILGNRLPDALPIAAVPSLSSLPARFGCMYVLEGSTLGGQLISRQITEVLGLTPQNGCSFFFSHGTEAGNMWSKFRQTLECYASGNPENSAEMVQSAITTFQIFRDWIKQRP